MLLRDIPHNTLLLLTLTIQYVSITIHHLTSPRHYISVKICHFITALYKYLISQPRTLLYPALHIPHFTMQTQHSSVLYLTAQLHQYYTNTTQLSEPNNHTTKTKHHSTLTELHSYNTIYYHYMTTLNFAYATHIPNSTVPNRNNTLRP